MWIVYYLWLRVLLFALTDGQTLEYWTPSWTVHPMLLSQASTLRPSNVSQSEIDMPNLRSGTMMMISDSVVVSELEFLNSTNPHIIVPGSIEVERINRTKSCACPGFVLSVERDWYAGARVRFKFLDENEEDWTTIHLHLPNFKVVSSSSSRRRASVEMKEVGRGRLEFHRDPSLVQWPDTDMILEKRHHDIQSLVLTSMRLTHRDGHSCGANFDDPRLMIQRETTRRRLEEEKSLLHHMCESNNATTNVVSLSTIGIGNYHYCILKSDDRITCGGQNNYHQAILNVPDSSKFIQVSAYDHHSCAILATTRAPVCWGASYLEYHDFAYAPVDFVDSSPWAQFLSISAGGLHACGLTTDGTVRCFGSNDFGQASDMPGQWTQVSAGYRHTCGLTTRSELICWGECGHGECDVPSASASSRYRHVSAGDRVTCAVDWEHVVTCWGLNVYGRTEAPDLVRFASVELAKGGYHACGITLDDQRAVCWGYLRSHQTFDTSRRYQSLSLGVYHTCGVTLETHEVICGGMTGLLPEAQGSIVAQHSPEAFLCQEWESTSDSSGSSGSSDSDINNATTDANNATNKHHETTEVVVPEFSFPDETLDVLSYRLRKSVAAGSSFACATRAYRHYDGRPICWGTTVLGGIAQRLTYNMIATEVSQEHQMACHLHLTGQAICYSVSTDDFGNHIGRSFQAPRDAFVQISMLGLHGCGLKSNTKIKCWGFNDDGQCDVPDLNFAYVSAGSFHTCAITLHQALVCWGRNNVGQTDVPGNTEEAGSNINSQSSSPQRYISVASGDRHTCAIRYRAQTVLCWGDNTSGQTDAPRGKFWQVAAGKFHTCGLKWNYAIECWGANEDEDHQDDTLRAPSGLFSSVSVGYDQSCATAFNGSVYCWGSGAASIPASVAAPYHNYLSIDEILALRAERQANMGSCGLDGFGMHHNTDLCVEEVEAVNVTHSSSHRVLLQVETDNCVVYTTYHQALAYCQDRGARLPTFHETAQYSSQMALHPCVDVNTIVWTSSDCIQLTADTSDSGNLNANSNSNLGKLATVLALRENGERLSICQTATNDSQNPVLNVVGQTAFPACVRDTHELRSSCALGHACDQNCVDLDNLFVLEHVCTCDDGFELSGDGRSCFPSLALRSPKTCQELGWPVVEEQGCCVEEDITCVDMTKMNMYQAQEHCVEKHGRLPTLQELQSGKLKGHPVETCVSSSDYLWTMTSGGETRGKIVSSIQGDHYHQALDNDNKESHYVVCVADPDLDECTLRYHSCEDECINVEGSYTCVCSGENQTLAEDGMSCIPTPVDRSRHTCETLEWPYNQTQTQDPLICTLGHTSTNVTIIDEPLTYLEARDYCHQRGARLPTMQEVLSNQTSFAGVVDSTDRVWTDTSCSRDCVPIVGKITIRAFGHEPVCFVSQPFIDVDQEKAFVLCVADRQYDACTLGGGNEACADSCEALESGYQCTCSSSSSSSVDKAGSQECTEDRTEVSFESCQTLGWETHHETQSICAISKGVVETHEDRFWWTQTERSCSGLVDFDTAEALCRARGARLPTAEEVVWTSSSDGYGSGCGYNLERIWTSTSCFHLTLAEGIESTSVHPSHVTLLGAGTTSPVCAPGLGVAYVRCVADSDVNECELDQSLCSSSNLAADDSAVVHRMCLNENQGYSCACPPNARWNESTRTCELKPAVVRSTQSCDTLGWTSTTKGLCASATIAATTVMFSLPTFPISNVTELYHTCSTAVSYTTATNLCAQLGARLPTWEELRQGATIGSGCGYEFERVWTRTSCAKYDSTLNSTRHRYSGHVTGAARTETSDIHPYQCMLSSGSSSVEKAFVQCVADTVVDECALPHVCPLANQQCISTPGQAGHACICAEGMEMSGDSGACVVPQAGQRNNVSRATCSELSWSSHHRKFQNHNHTCGHSRIVPKEKKLRERHRPWLSSPESVSVLTCEYNAVTYAQAKDMCELIGARLPTLDELLSDVTRNTGCWHNHRRIWTSSRCQQHHDEDASTFGRISGPGASRKLITHPLACASSLSHDLAHVRCVADEPTYVQKPTSCSETTCDQECIAAGSRAACTCSGGYTLERDTCVESNVTTSPSFCSTQKLKLGWQESSPGKKNRRKKNTKEKNVCFTSQTPYAHFFRRFSKRWKKTCSVKMSYTEAMTLCRRQQARLPTMDEIESNFFQHDECQHASKEIWTSAPCALAKINPEMDEDDLSSPHVVTMGGSTTALDQAYPKHCVSTEQRYGAREYQAFVICVAE